MIDSMNDPACPCGTGKLFTACCEPFLTGRIAPRTPEQLMRSRYTAYCQGGQGVYLLQSWFPATARGLTATELSARTVQWQGLNVLSSSQDGDTGEVEFIASFRDADGNPGQLHEKSVFQRVAGRWFYVGGVVSA